MGDSTQFLPRALTLAKPPSVSSLALPVSLGLRGMVVVADKTAELYKTTYWASYNIPYVPFHVTHPPHLSSPRQGPSPLSCCESSVTSRSGTCCRVVWGGHTLGLALPGVQLDLPASWEMELPMRYPG